MHLAILTFEVSMYNRIHILFTRNFPTFINPVLAPYNPGAQWERLRLFYNNTQQIIAQLNNVQAMNHTLLIQRKLDYYGVLYTLILIVTDC